MQQVLTAPAVSFRHFTRVWCRDAIVTSLLAMVSMFFLFKMVYVDPDFSEVSFVYLEKAGGANWQPLYLPFLRLVHAVTPSPWVLVAVQYLLLQAATFWLVLVVCWVMQADAKRAYWLLMLLAINPLALFIANHISVDVFYATLLFAWAAILVMAMKQNTVLLLFSSIIGWGVLIATRYQALWLFPVLLLILYRYQRGLQLKLLGLVFSVALVAGLLAFAGAFKSQAEWKQYNNGLYIIEAPTGKSVEIQPVPESAAGKLMYYATPQLEHFTQYSMGRTVMSFGAWQWFRTQNAFLNCHWYKGSYYLMSPFRVIWLLLLFMAAASVIRLWKKNEWLKLPARQRSGVLLLVVLLLCHLVFSYTAMPLLLRCQLPAVVLALLLVGSVPRPPSVCS